MIYPEPFDVFLFSGRRFVSYGIKTLTASPWSHVGIALRFPWSGGDVLFEATSLDGAAGVQLVGLRDRIDNYDGAVAWRGIEGIRSGDMIAKADAFVRAFEGRPYERNKRDLFAAALDRGFDLAPADDATSVFCSELAALLLREVSIIPTGARASEFVPGDFANNLILNEPYKWKKPQLIKG